MNNAITGLWEVFGHVVRQHENTESTNNNTNPLCKVIIFITPAVINCHPPLLKLSRYYATVMPLSFISKRPPRAEVI